MLTFGSLFAGIGGFDLGFERAGMKCLWQVEINEYCRRVLAKHWPSVRRWDDVRTWPQPDTERVDVICGGFPCQDISLAGGRAGLAGERSGLWAEYIRIVRILRPSFVVVENVPGLLAPTRPGDQAPIGVVLGELAECGYDAEWQSIPASAFGSTQERYRVFVIAYPSGHRDRPGMLPAGSRREGQREADTEGSVDPVGGPWTAWHTDPYSAGLSGRASLGGDTRQKLQASERVCPEDHADLERGEWRQGATEDGDGDKSGERRTSGEPDRCDSPFVGTGWWSSEPAVVRMVYGVPRRVVRPAITGLGNAVVPQVAEWIGRRIVEAMESSNAE